MPETALHDDQRYIEGLLRNDDQVIDAIYRHFAGTIKRWVCANSGSPDDAADIFQESLLAIYRQAREKRLVLTCPFESFLLMVCKRKWWNELKKRNRKGVTISIDSVSEISEETNDLLQQEERDQLVSHFFQQLGDRCREIIAQTLGSEHQEKVAARLGVSYAYLRKKKSECMGKLTQMIKKSPEFRIMKDQI